MLWDQNLTQRFTTRVSALKTPRINPRSIRSPLVGDGRLHKYPQIPATRFLASSQPTEGGEQLLGRAELGGAAASSTGTQPGHALQGQYDADSFRVAGKGTSAIRLARSLRMRISPSLTPSLLGVRRTPLPEAAIVATFGGLSDSLAISRLSALILWCSRAIYRHHDVLPPARGG